MIRGMNNSRSKKLTVKFATEKAIVYMALLGSRKPVAYTEDILRDANRIGIDHHTSYSMCLEALHELTEQGFVDHVGSTDGGYYWYSMERCWEAHYGD